MARRHYRASRSVTGMVNVLVTDYFVCSVSFMSYPFVVPPISVLLDLDLATYQNQLKFQDIHDLIEGSVGLRDRPPAQLSSSRSAQPPEPGYGMTESTAVGIRSFNNRKYRKYSLIGLLARKMQAKVVDWNSGSSLPPGFYGELWLRGTTIMQAPADLEAILISHPEILDADVTSATGEVCGEIPVAFVVRRHESKMGGVYELNSKVCYEKDPSKRT
ncbi:hypothetical protein GQ457_08G024780 [Hibiscus cannabinus]